ncbi:UNVERIFIED_CONTAM: hypothetical protein ABID98_005528 [Brevibacillus sp. OAP136]
MLTFEEKQAIIASFPELQEKKVSLGRLNYQYEESLHEKKNVVYHLHPNGNGFVYAGHLKGYQKDDKGMVNIRDYSADDLRTLIEKVIHMLSQPPYVPPAKEAAGADVDEPQEETWRNKEGHTLLLVHENELWNLYDGVHLESAFESYKEAALYLHEEGFRHVE